MPDQTYLQQAQPSTFGHYVLAFAYPALRDAERLRDGLDWVNRSPGGAGCVNGSRLHCRADARSREAAGLRRRHRAHPRRDVADRRLRRPARDRRQPGLDPQQAGRGPGDLGQPGVRLRRPGRRLHARKRAHATEAQPLRAVDRPGRRGRPDRAALRLPGGGEDPIGPQRQPDLRLRRGTSVPRARPAGHPADDRRGPTLQVNAGADVGGAGARLLPGHRPRGVRDADLRGRLPQRVPAGRRGRPPGEPPGPARRRSDRRDA